MNENHNTIHPNDIKSNPYQRQIRQERVLYYADKMKHEGYNESYPITLDADGVLVDGGHRVEAARIAEIESVPFVTTDKPRIAHSLRCNRDGADTMKDDVFDLAELCWSLGEDDWKGPEIAKELGWFTEAQVSYYRQIKEKLHPVAWSLARGLTKIQGLLIDSGKPLVNSELTIVNWRESHFRSLLQHVGHDSPTSVQRYAQVQAIKAILARFDDPQKKVTAKNITPIAQKYAWYAQLVQYTIDHTVNAVSGKDKGQLIKEVYANVFGNKGPDKEPMTKIERAVSALNEHALGVRLYYDDAFQRIPLLDDGSIALIVTDPPYNVTDEEWDQVGTDEEYLEFMQLWLKAVAPKLTKDYHLFLFCSPHYQADIELMLRQDDWPIQSRIVWSHRNLSMGRGVKDKFISTWEMCFHCGTHALNWSEEWSEERFDVQVFAAPQSNFEEGKHHPTAKPVELITHLIRLGSQPGDQVLDMFAGGGTTGAACAAVGQRQCILIERSDKFCKVIEQRLEIKRQEE